MSEDRNRQVKIAWLKQRERAGLSFLEIVNAYNATFGTNHFAEVLGNHALPGKRDLGKELKQFWLGDDGFGL